jgi:hypothetical protein
MRCVQPLALQKARPNHAWTRITPDALVLLTTSTKAGDHGFRQSLSSFSSLVQGT